jgi:isoamylase
MTAVSGLPLTVRPGNEFPLGATADDEGTNFAVASSVADGMVLCLFDEAGMETQIQLRDYDSGVWHVLPVTRENAAWRLEVDTYDPAATGRSAPAQAAGQPVTVGPRSIVVLSGPRQD